MLSNTSTVCCIYGVNSKDNLKKTDGKLLLPEIPKSLKNKKSKSRNYSSYFYL